jgi:hypothetical protein
VGNETKPVLRIFAGHARGEPRARLTQDCPKICCRKRRTCCKVLSLQIAGSTPAAVSKGLKAWIESQVSQYHSTRRGVGERTEPIQSAAIDFKVAVTQTQESTRQGSTPTRRTRWLLSHKTGTTRSLQGSEQVGRDWAGPVRWPPSPRKPTPGVKTNVC